jgi:hypothetical protein
MTQGRLIMVTQGAGEDRVFRPGGLLETTECGRRGYAIRALEGRSFQAAVINLEDGAECRLNADGRPPSEQSLPFIRNATGDDGHSHFQDGALPYFTGEGGSLVTDEIAISRYQYVLALGGLSFDFHKAAQRQIVLPLTGGIEGENGDGRCRQVAPGGLYFGEDTTGQGHITRALNSQAPFSIFAHLA